MCYPCPRTGVTHVFGLYTESHPCLKKNAGLEGLGMGIPDPADLKLQGFGPSESSVGHLGRLRSIQGPGEPGKVCHGVF